MNDLKLDRRAAACALTFGLKAPCIAIPAGFKLIEPWPQQADGKVVEFHRLGGLLKSYRRVRVEEGEPAEPMRVVGRAMAA